MMQKSVAYMLVAVVVGFMLISTVPGQIEMFATPKETLSMESGEATTVELTGKGFTPDEVNGTVELYWDNAGNMSTLNTTEGFDVWFDVPNATTGRGGPWNGSIEVEEYGFTVNSSSGDFDINEQVADLAVEVENLTVQFEIAKSDIADVAAVAEDAVAAAEAASEAVGAVAATANAASGSGVNAAEAASAARDAASGLSSFVMGFWWILDILIALGVYWFAKQRFS